MCDCANRVVTGYSGKYGFQIGASDPSCPNCRVGAFAAGDARPPMPFAQGVKPAGQSYTASAPGQTWFTGLGVRFLAANGIDCAKWISISRVSQLSFLRNIFLDKRWPSRRSATDNAMRQWFVFQTIRMMPSLNTTRGGAAFEQALSQLLQLITNDCLRSQFVAANTPRLSVPVGRISR